jgi:hypothetical protein
VWIEAGGMGDGSGFYIKNDELLLRSPWCFLVFLVGCAVLLLLLLMFLVLKVEIISGTAVEI